MSSLPRKRSCAFTLTELLVSIAIIGSLALILTVSVASVRERSDLVRCSGNLRQIGAAVLAYASEHNGTLPGPMGGGVQIEASEWGMRPKNRFNLVNFLAPYFDVQGLATGALVPLPVFECPGARRALQRQSPDIKQGVGTRHFIHLATWISPGVQERGFGFGDSTKIHLYPLKLTQIQNLSRSFALTDLDNELMGMFGDIASDRPQVSVHGKVRNMLFFDGHVEAMENSRLSAMERAVKID